MIYYNAWKFPGIYLIVNTINGKVYVGQAVNIANRIDNHMHPTSPSRYITRAIRHYGKDAFEILVAERVDNLELLTGREQWWMDALQSYDRERGYNLCPASESTRGYKYTSEQIAARGAYWTPERRAKKSADMKEHYENHSYPASGKGPKSPETRAKISSAKRNQIKSPETRAKISAMQKRRFEDPDERLKLSAAQRAGWARKKLATEKTTPPLDTP
jgi:group I intron endonuclease